jgi:hypothetical protein
MHITKRFAETFKSIYGLDYTTTKLKEFNETMVCFNSQPDCYLRYLHKRHKGLIVYHDQERRKDFMDFLSPKYNIDDEYKRKIPTQVYVMEFSKRKKK